MSQESNFNSDVDEFEEITYNGKDYFLDEENIVLEMSGDGVFIPVGKLIKRNPIEIDFSGAKHLALNVDYETDNSEFSENEEDYSDLEESEEEDKPKPKKEKKKIEDEESDSEQNDEDDYEEELYEVTLNGKTYLADGDNDVFQESGTEYKYVGILISNEPVKINFFVDYHGNSYLINEKTGTIEDKETKAPIGKQLQKEPLKLVFYKEVSPTEPMSKISSTLSVDKKLDVYEGKKQIGYLIKVDSGLKKAIELKEGLIITLGSFQLVEMNGSVYVIITSVPSTEKEFLKQIKTIEGLPVEIKRHLTEKEIPKKSEEEFQLNNQLASIQGRLVKLKEQNLNADSTEYKSERVKLEKEKLSYQRMLNESILKTMRKNIGSIRQLNGENAAKSAGDVYLKKKQQFKKEIDAQTKFIETLESPKQEENDEETVDMSEIEYLGKPYVVDMATKEVYEKNEAHDDYHLVGKLEKNGSVRFINKANWLDEYEDIETMSYRGIEYKVNPNTKNVFLFNKSLDEYEHVGEVITLSPLKIRLESEQNEVNQNEEVVEAETDEKEEEDDELVEVEIIESHGKKFIRDAEQNVYEPQRFELIGTWDSEDNEIDYIPNRGFLNIDNSCYLDSVLFALFYRNNSFINTSILRKDIDAMMRKLRIDKPSVIEALKTNQAELLRLYKWLHHPETTVDDIKVCQNFRAIYKQVSLENNPAALKIHGFEKELGDSAEFLFGLFNGFGIKTLIKEMTSMGKNGEEVREIIHTIEETAPIITVGVKAKPEQYYNNESISTESKGNMFSTVMKMSDEDEEAEKELVGRIKIEQIKILLEFFKTKTRVVKQDKTRMTARIEDMVRNKKLSDSQIEEIKQIFNDLYTKVLPKELKAIQLDAGESIISLKARLTELEDRYRFKFAEKIDRTTYQSIDGPDHHYIVLNVDRGLQSGKSLVRDKTAFDIRQTILCPRGENIQLQFVVKYIDSPKHYVCYFKNIDDDLWYLYNDLNKSFRIVSSGAQDKTPGTFEKMKAETATGCTLLFYNK
jgi:hypothetical protein